MKKIIVIFLCLLLTGCLNTNEDQIETISDDEFGASSLGLKYEFSNDKQTIHYLNDEKQKYSPTISVTNHLSVEKTFRLFFFLNYKQTSVEKDGDIISSIDLKLKPNERKEFYVNVPNISTGKHDFMVASLRSPDYSLDQDKTIVEDQFFLYRRALIVKGDSHIEPNINFKRLISKSTNLQYNGPFITKKDMLTTSFDNIINILRDPKHLIANIEIKNDKQNKFSLIFLTNKGQIFPLEETYFEATHIGQVIVPFQLNPKEVENNNLFILSTTNPYEEDLQPGVPLSTHSSNFISVKIVQGK